jgi:hypothetical protein
VDVLDLKKFAVEMMESIAAFGVKYRTKSELRSIVVARMRDLHDLDDAARKVVGDHVMSLYGYGGGVN